MDKFIWKPKLRIIPEKGTKQLASIVLFSWRRRNRDHGAAAQVHDGLPLLPTCQCSRCGAVAPSFSLLLAWFGCWARHYSRRPIISRAQWPKIPILMPSGEKNSWAVLLCNSLKSLCLKSLFWLLTPIAKKMLSWKLAPCQDIVPGPGARWFCLPERSEGWKKVAW